MLTVSLSIRNVPEDVVARLRARTARNHRSLQAELLHIITSVLASEGEHPGGWRAGPADLASIVPDIGASARRADSDDWRGS